MKRAQKKEQHKKEKREENEQCSLYTQYFEKGKFFAQTSISPLDVKKLAVYAQEEHVPLCYWQDFQDGMKAALKKE